MVRAPERERKGRRVHSGGCLAAYTLWKEGQGSMEEKVKLKDIAERLGVSIVAVSKALNDKDGISDKLKEKVRQVALEMGYETAVMRNRLNRSAASILVIVARNALSDINMTQSFYLGFFEKLSEEFLTYRYLTQLFVLEKEDEGALKKPDLLDKCDNVAGAIFLGECAADYVSAARVDGAGTVRIFLTIVLPVLKPALAAVAIFSFQGFWNDYMGPLIYIKDPDLYTVAQALTLYQMPQETLWGDMMAAALVTILPIVFCFAFCQKYFIQGITLGGVKG